MEVIVPQKLAAVYAGDVSQALELIGIYSAHLCAYNELSADILHDALRFPLRLMKERLVEALVQRRIALTYNAFLERSQQIDPSLRAAIFSAIDDLSIPASLIIAGFTDIRAEVALPRPEQKPLIFKIEYEAVKSEQNFACVGDGAAAAELSLHRRKQSRFVKLPATLYNVYEAKKLSEIARSVGSTTDMLVIKPGSSRWVNGESIAALDAYFDRYGPQSVGDLGMVSDPGKDVFYEDGLL